MRRWSPLLAVLIAAACVRPGGSVDRPEVLLATTTSFQDSGLLDVLAADFQKHTPYRLRATAVGTGAALAIGARGDADVLFVHAPTQELAYMQDGNGDRRVLVMHNDFVLVGPPSDPAHVRGKNVFDALRVIASAGAPFISRGDNSGTDIFEKNLWKQAAVSPTAPWYVEAATGMGQTLTVASEKRAYTLSDRGTFLARKRQVDLQIEVERDPPLINIYHVITVSPKKFPKVNVAGANAFADYLVSPETQGLIASFGVDKYGEPLFFPDAGKTDADVR
ncbi:MAG: tungsten ABC transporter substrate-binding protein [Chloroflexi bacterium]|nr:MAG: tungsten ABC transporter substrate-binding protein [Chloroflexota bacterium]